jgi:hypothetical protein
MTAAPVIAHIDHKSTQTPVVHRLGDVASAAPILSLPNFYGAHGYDPTLPNMSAIFMAAGPDIRRGSLTRVNNIDVAPTAARLLGVKLSILVEGHPLPIRIPRRVKSSLIAELVALLPTVDQETARRLERALERLTRSLAATLWADDAHLTWRGARVFLEERHAADELLKIASPSPVVLDVLGGIVSIDEELAAIALDEAAAFGGDDFLIFFARAWAMPNAAAAAAAGHYRQAIDYYAQAWAFAR